MRNAEHTIPGPVQARASNPGGPVTVHTDPTLGQATVTLAPLATGDDTALDRIERAEIRSDGQRFIITLPELPTTVLDGGTTMITRNGSMTTIVQTAGTITGPMIGAQIVGGTVITGNGMSTAQSAGQVQLHLHVPAESSLTARSTGGDVTTAGTLSEVDVDTSGGDITLDCALGSVELNTSGGTIRLGTNHDRVEARTSGGDVRATDLRRGGTLRTSGGDVRACLSGPHPLSARTSGGDIRLNTSGEATQGHLSWRTSGGQVVINGRKHSSRSEL